MIYFNHAATSYPKNPAVIEAVQKALLNGALYSGRDSVDAQNVERRLFTLREILGRTFLGLDDDYHLCFASNSTLALNQILFGRILHLQWAEKLRNAVILCSDREHNSVMRPLEEIRIRYSVPWVSVPTDNGSPSLERLEQIVASLKASRQNIIFGVFSHANNITGDLIDAKELSSALSSLGIPFILDATQSVGLTDVLTSEWHVAAVAFAGHKGLGGPQGTGGFAVCNGFDLHPLLHGGTGHSTSRIQPDIAYPDSFEVGTPAVHDLLGLLASLDAILETGIEAYRKRILNIAEYCAGELGKLPQITIVGAHKKKIPILSFFAENKSGGEIAQFLWEKAKVVCRTGYLCSPMTLKSLGNSPIVRLSFGEYNTKHEVDVFIDALKQVVLDA